MSTPEQQPVKPPLPPHPDLQQGLYRHRFGKLYRTTGFAWDATGDQWVIQYTEADRPRIMFTRTIEDFNERFMFIGSTRL